jgi:uncharacterized protein
MSKQIIQKDITPELKKDNYYRGIDNAVNSIISISKGEFTKVSKENNGSNPSILEVLAYLIPVLLFIVVMTILVKNIKRKSTGLGSSGVTTYYSNSSSESSWSGSDSSSSGSDSGFSGDGGDSGGGGASGDY